MEKPIPRASYSFQEWCALRRISRVTGWRLIRDGEIRTYKIGSRRYITAEADSEFISRREAEAST